MELRKDPIPDFAAQFPDDSPVNAETVLGSAGLHRAFGFDLEADAWLARVRALSGDSAAGGLGALGGYELLEAIGRGGQGIVYKARQPNTGRLVALKRISAGVFATPDMRARFEREIEAAAALDHPHIVTVYGSETFDGQPVLAMQWIDGVPFDQWAALPDGTRRGVREVLEAFVQVCDAIQHAHQRGVIHRDIKPSNILVDKDNRPHVLDFGLAKLSADDSRDAGLTETGAFVGTPAFAAPEQLRGRPQDVDVRSDVYALAAVLYRALTGAVPFTPAEDLPTLLADLEHRVAKPPSAIDARLNPEIDAILLKALASDKTHRYPSVDGFRDDIQRWLNGEAVLAHPPSRWYEFRKLVRRKRWAFASGTVIALLTIVFAVVASWLAWNHAMQRDVADKNAQDANREAQRARLVAKLMDDMLSSADPHESRDANLQVRELLDRFEAQLGNTLADQPLVEASIRETVGGAYRGLGLLDKAQTHLGRALALYRLELGPDDPRTAEALKSLAMVLHDQGRFQECLDSLSAAHRLQATKLGDQSEAATYTLISISDALRHLGRLKEAEQEGRKALEQIEALFAALDARVSPALTNLALILRETGEYETAETLLRRAETILRTTVGTQDSRTIQCVGNLGAVLRTRGKYDEATIKFREVLAQRRQLLGNEHQDTAQAMHHLAGLLHEKGELSEAETLFRDALAIFRERLGEEHHSTAMCLHNLALLESDRDVRVAQPLMDDATKLTKKNKGEESPEVAAALNNQALILHKKGDYRGAELLYRDALTMRRRIRGEKHAEVATTLQNLAALLKDKRDYYAAESTFREALAMRREFHGNDHPNVAVTLQNLAGLFQVTNRYAEAEPLAREAVAIFAARNMSEHRHALIASMRLSGILKKLGQFDESESIMISTWATMEGMNELDPKLRSDACLGFSRLYDAWHKADPGKGYDAKAGEWNMRLDAVRDNATSPAQADAP